ncbi:biotin--[acetyl-CoA-carboxylase] ligase [Brachybacterium endophyticum]|uniref:biotin--[biotin carboxyl-carrier protein] ligase n=1 Tax=Brachybacterium endophyticum TaxID=2182385 RepID=A0A2U2RGL0_9MICO|nr:biotin--[acetyl-CoA-carboxylase] ligase [Brachybacterium endophyticum]PWH04996.1 biotin--[acetyl-CoA-carboxylase] ligase [Brachybacterium endophyticum]
MAPAEQQVGPGRSDLGHGGDRPGPAPDERPAPPPLHVLETTSSTQDAAREMLRDGAATPFAVHTLDQRGGRGRLGRPWRTPPGGGLALTLARTSSLRPDRRSWYPLVVGLGVLEALAGTAELGLKWPNDLLTPDGRKLGGILLEAEGQEHLLVGVGLNLRGPIVLEDPSALPPAWLHGEGGVAHGHADAGPEGEAAGAEDDREGALAAALAARIEDELRLLDVHEGDAVASGQHSRYSMACLTLGCGVRFHAATVADPAADSSAGAGTAVRIDADGGLVLRTPDGDERSVSAGDIRHLRTTSTSLPDHQEIHP